MKIGRSANAVVTSPPRSVAREMQEGEGLTGHFRECSPQVASFMTFLKRKHVTTAKTEVMLEARLKESPRVGRTVIKLCCDRGGSKGTASDRLSRGSARRGRRGLVARTAPSALSHAPSRTCVRKGPLRPGLVSAESLTQLSSEVFSPVSRIILKITPKPRDAFLGRRTECHIPVR